VTFTPDARTYLRTHAVMAALAMAAAMALLWIIGNPHVWTGAIGGLAAVALRGWFLKSEDLAAIWTLTPTSLDGPAGRSVRLDQIAKVRNIGAAVQVITKTGDKHLIKFQDNPAATRAEILAAIPDSQ
jgi:hypothetical protein